MGNWDFVAGVPGRHTWGRNLYYSRVAGTMLVSESFSGDPYRIYRVKSPPEGQALEEDGSVVTGETTVDMSDFAGKVFVNSENNGRIFRREGPGNWVLAFQHSASGFRFGIPLRASSSTLLAGIWAYDNGGNPAFCHLMRSTDGQNFSVLKDYGGGRSLWTINVFGGVFYIGGGQNGGPLDWQADSGGWLEQWDGVTFTDLEFPSGNGAVFDTLVRGGDLYAACRTTAKLWRRRGGVWTLVLDPGLIEPGNIEFAMGQFWYSAYNDTTSVIYRSETGDPGSWVVDDQIPITFDKAAAGIRRRLDTGRLLWCGFRSDQVLAVYQRNHILGTRRIFGVIVAFDLSLVGTYSAVKLRVTTRADVGTDVAPTSATAEYIAPVAKLDISLWEQAARLVLGQVLPAGFDPTVDTTYEVDVTSAVNDAKARGEGIILFRIKPTSHVQTPDGQAAFHNLWGVDAPDPSKRPRLVVIS